MTDPIKSYFPIFNHFPDLIYLDNASTTQRPATVIDRISHFYAHENANIHRGIYDLSNTSSALYELARKKMANYLNSEEINQIAFTKGTTESINIVAQSFLKPRLKKEDNIVTTITEHHSNFIPWQQLAKAEGIEFRIAKANQSAELSLTELDSLLDQNTKLLAISHISNSIGTIHPIGDIIALAHKKNIPVLVDAAQSAALYDLDSQQYNYDFLVFSGHKMFGPFGIGVLYVATKWMPEMNPYNFGGGIIHDVTLEGLDFKNYPYHLEAGTPNISGAIGLMTAVEFLETLDKEKYIQHQQILTSYAKTRLQSLSEIKITGNPTQQAGIISFTVDQIHPHEVASFLNQDQIAVRAGMHCTQPLLTHLGLNHTVRISFSIYNQLEDVDRLYESLSNLLKFWN